MSFQLEIYKKNMVYPSPLSRRNKNPYYLFLCFAYTFYYCKWLKRTLLQLWFKTINTYQSLDLPFLDISRWTFNSTQNITYLCHCKIYLKSYFKNSHFMWSSLFNGHHCLTWGFFLKWVNSIISYSWLSFG